MKRAFSIALVTLLAMSMLVVSASSSLRVQLSPTASDPTAGEGGLNILLVNNDDKSAYDLTSITGGTLGAPVSLPDGRFYIDVVIAGIDDFSGWQISGVSGSNVESVIFGASLDILRERMVNGAWNNAGTLFGTTLAGTNWFSIGSVVNGVNEGTNRGRDKIAMRMTGTALNNAGNLTYAGSAVTANDLFYVADNVIRIYYKPYVGIGTGLNSSGDSVSGSYSYACNFVLRSQDNKRATITITSGSGSTGNSSVSSLVDGTYNIQQMSLGNVSMSLWGEETFDVRQGEIYFASDNSVRLTDVRFDASSSYGFVQNVLLSTSANVQRNARFNLSYTVDLPSQYEYLIEDGFMVQYFRITGNHSSLPATTLVFEDVWESPLYVYEVTNNGLVLHNNWNNNTAAGMLSVRTNSGTIPALIVTTANPNQVGVYVPEAPSVPESSAPTTPTTPPTQSSQAPTAPTTPSTNIPQLPNTGC